MIFDKKGLFGPGGGPRQPLSLLVGLIFLVLGVVPLLNNFNVIAFAIPINPIGILLWILATVGGVVLLWDAISEKMPTPIESKIRLASLVTAIVLLVIGVVPILTNFGVISLILPTPVGIIKDILFTVVGVLLVYGASKSF